MDVTLSEEQLALQSTARRLFAERAPVQAVGTFADAVDPADAVDAKLWAELGALGFVGLAENGGDFTQDAVLIEEAGYALAPVPLLSTAIAAPAARPADTGTTAATVAWAEPVGADGGGTDAFGPPDQVRVRAVLDGTGTVRLDGRKVDVPDLQPAELLVVLATLGGVPSACVVHLAAEERNGELQVSYPPTLDGTRRVAQVVLMGAAALAPRDDAAQVVSAVRRRAFAGLAAESVGVARRALDLAVAHASTREQFGRPIGSYQAVAHRVADVYVAVELARSLAYRAAYWVTSAEVRGDDAETDVACAAAKAAAGEAAVTACETLIQVLGGMGMTWEHVAHRLYKRAMADRAYGGTPAAHRATIAAALLDD